MYEENFNAITYLSHLVATMQCSHFKYKEASKFSYELTKIAQNDEYK